MKHILKASKSEVDAFERVSEEKAALARLQQSMMPLAKEINSLETNAWNKIVFRLGLNTELYKYAIDHRTGIVSREDKR